jgi:chromate transport protein ChrA
LVFALLSPPAVLVGLALWLWLHWQQQARWRWIVAGLLLVVCWAVLVLLWDTLASQLVALREAITGYTGVSTLLTRALPVWGEGTLLGPTIAGLVQLFRPQKLNRTVPADQPAQPALPEQPTQQPLSGVAKRLTLPSPAVRPDQPPDASALAS